MITAARLLPYNKKKGMLMRSYTSASGTSYRSGDESIGMPSSWRVLRSRAERDELKSIDQFDVREFDSLGELKELVVEEMEANARVGKPAVRAMIDGQKPGRVPKAPQRDLSVLKKTSTDEEEDDDDDDDNENGDDGSEEDDDDSSEEDDDALDADFDESDDDETSISTTETRQYKISDTDPPAVVDAKKALNDAFERGLSARYITRLENRLKEVLSE